MIPIRGLRPPVQPSKPSAPQHIRRDTTTWCPRSDGILERMWRADETAAVIGEALGVSRGAIIGRAQRIGLPRKTQLRAQQDRRGEGRR